MSRLPWAPPIQQGTEVFPATTRVPVKTVVTVAPGADRDAAREVYARSQAVINKFYLKAAQAHAQGIVDISAAHMELPGLKLRYSNQQGVEIVHVEVTATVAKPKGGAEEVGAWDFLLVDIDIPIWSDGYADKPYERAARGTFAAQMVAPPPNGSALDQQLFDSAFQQSLGDDPQLMFAGAARGEEIGSETTVPDVQRSSLLVDIRPYRTLRVIELDIYGRLTPLGIGREIRAVITRYVDTGAGGAPVAERFYTGGLATLDYITEHFPDLDAGVTTDTVATSGQIDAALIPSPYSRATLPDSVLRDAATFGPTTASWIDDNLNLTGIARLWGANMPAQWADVAPPFSWAGGAWTSGWDFAWWQGQLDTLTAPPDGDVRVSPHSQLGIGAITQRGEPFWYYDAFGGGAADFWDTGDPGTPPPNVTGVPDSGSSYAEIFVLGQVWNTYIFLPVTVSAPATVSSDATLRASAFKGFGLDGGPAVFKWSRRRPEINDLLDYLNLTEWSFGQWETEDMYPERLEIGPLNGAEAVTVTQQLVAENPGSGQYLGRLTFFQDVGAFAWRPAES